MRFDRANLKHFPVGTKVITNLDAGIARKNKTYAGVIKCRHPVAGHVCISGKGLARYGAGCNGSFKVSLNIPGGWMEKEVKTSQLKTLSVKDKKALSQQLDSILEKARKLRADINDIWKS